MRRMVAMIAATRSACAGFRLFGAKRVLFTRSMRTFGAKRVESGRGADWSASCGQLLCRSVLARAPSDRKPVEKAIDVLIENLTPQPVEVITAVLPDVDQTRVIEDLDVVRDRRFGDRERLIQNSAGQLICTRDHAHDLDANWLAERAENLCVLRLRLAGHAETMVGHRASPAPSPAFRAPTSATVLPGGASPSPIS